MFNSKSGGNGFGLHLYAVDIMQSLVQCARRVADGQHHSSAPFDLVGHATFNEMHPHCRTSLVRHQIGHGGPKVKINTKRHEILPCHPQDTHQTIRA